MSQASAPVPSEKNHWVRPVALIVLAMMMIWNATGWAVDKGETFEGVFLVLFTLGLMALGINASAQLRRCYARVDGPAVRLVRRFWLIVLIATSLWSAGSAHHAYGQLVANEVVWAWSFEAMFALLNAAPLLIVLTAMAFFEPLLLWAIETVEQAERKNAVRPLENKAETAAPKINIPPPPRSPRPIANQAQTRPALTRKTAPSLPLTEDELKQAIDSLANREGAKVVSLATVAREAQNILGRPVPKKRVEEHPKRRELFDAVKSNAA